jgi:integrase
MPRQEALDGDIHLMPGRQKDGKDYYRLRYRDAAGKVRWTGLGRGTNKELNERAREFRKSLEQGPEPVARGRSRTVSQAWEAYRNDRLRDLRKSTRQGYESIWRRHLEAPLGSLAVREVARDRLRGILDGNAELSVKTRNHLLETMKAFFAYCEQQGFATRNPARDIAKLRTPEPAKLAATGPDINALKTELETNWSRQDFLLIWVLEVSGLRLGEALALQWSDMMGRGWRLAQIDVRQDFVRGEVGPTKTEASKRSVPITPRLRDALELTFNQRGAKPGDFVFTADDGTTPLGGDNWRKRVFTLASRRACVSFKLKDLRDHAITRWVESGDMNLLEVQEIAGHTQPQTTMGYFRRSGASIAKARKAAERMGL